MNIEQKNTLFVVSLVMAVLFGIAAVASYLAQEHVSNSIERDLERARNVFIEAEKNRFDNLTSVARGVRAEPGLIASALTGDMGTVRGTLEDLSPRPGADFLAVYLGAGPGDIAGAGSRPQFTSLQLLNSKQMLGMVESLTRGAGLVAGNVLVYDTLLQVVATPIENPLGGRIGVLLVGRQFATSDLSSMLNLVQSDVAIFNGTTLLASSIDGLQRVLPDLDRLADYGSVNEFTVDGVDYSGSLLPMRVSADSKERAATVLLAAPHDYYWAPYLTLGRSALCISVVIVLVASFVGIWVSRKSLTRPLKLLVSATEAIGAGNFDQTVNIMRHDEIGQLSASFNTMLQYLNHSRSALERSRQRFRDFADSSSDWLWETDSEGRYIYVSAGVAKVLGVRAELFRGKTLSDIFPGSQINHLTALLAPRDRVPLPFKDAEEWITTSQGQYCLRVNGAPVLDAKHRFRGYRGTARDITKLKQDEHRMVVLANQDHLTGVANRRRFIQDLGREIRRMEGAEQTGVLLLIDLDHLKLVNDTAGHAAGDQIIVQVAGLLKRALREEDLLARISGDEFAAACSGMDDNKGMEKARQLLQSINKLKPLLGGRATNISASIGIVSIPRDGRQPVELLAKADAAMISAKQSGRNRIMFYNAADMSRERMDSQLAWKDRLIDALDHDGLFLMYQPIFSVSARKASHYEVLVRMRGDKGTYLPPDKFIPAAEQFGLIQRVDRIVITKAINALARLPQHMDNVGFSINLSGMTVNDPEIYPVIVSELNQSGIAPERVAFEITETAACEQLNSAVEFIEKVHQLGCKVLLDDFGVGFSSFSYLKHLHADMLKIDGSFIRDIHNSDSDRLFVKALVDVARGLGMDTIAEFVENQEVYDQVAALGVNYVQGYHIGRPTPDLTVPSMLAQQQEEETSEQAVVRA
jgi:diguanylate cyclase (GGDEF)-like protein/PAS domain S-box-containing protein